MIHFIEKKLNLTINTFFGLGLVCFALGVAALLNEFFIRVLIGLLFFFFAYIALHIAYHMQGIRDSVKGMVVSLGAKPATGETTAPKPKARRATKRSA